MCFSNFLLKKLRRYQEQALDFIMQRETGPTPEEYSLWKPKSSGNDNT